MRTRLVAQYMVIYNLRWAADRTKRRLFEQKKNLI